MLKLYDYFRSTACFRVRIALNLKELPYETISIHLVNQGGEQHSEQYQNINPQRLVPALQDDQRILTQSLSIIEYLEEKHPAPALLPKDAYHKSLVRSFALAIISDTHPLNNLRVLNYLVNELSLSEQQKLKWYHHWVNKTFSALEKQLQRESAKHAFCFGDIPSLADVCLIPQMFNARRFQCDISPFPRLVEIDAACQKLPAFKKAFPLDEAT